MAQRKSTPAGKSSRPGGKPGTSRPTGQAARKSAGSVSTSKTATAKTGSAGAKTGKPGAGGPANRKKPKSIVNQKQTPWGLIGTTAAIVVFAVAIVVAVIATRPSDSSGSASSRGGQTVKASDPYRQPELPAAAAIQGVTYRVQANHTHKDGDIKYDTTPPTGGDHNQFWADCTGTVYPKAIANENAVHMLEHGAIWITYNANEVTGAQLTKLKSYVSGIDRMAMSPFPNLSTPISLQAWGYQLKVSDANDPRIAEFIKVLKYNQKTTPEYGATCSQPNFKEDPSTFGKPTDPYS